VKEVLEMKTKTKAKAKAKAKMKMKMSEVQSTREEVLDGRKGEDERFA
jgi:hypothetical protein